MYMVMKMQQKNTTSTEGIEVLESRTFEDNVYGMGQYTSKVYHLQRTNQNKNEEEEKDEEEENAEDEEDQEEDEEEEENNEDND
ncbi:troponin T, skeletal muscle-like [Carya illinoinensis]|uniref:Phosphatidylinositol transfer protein N-terminal domain-containing protein n=1 Tax=Carya illinoinensis TaxID=32201 RepID=A0A8T1PKK9_CARIL|nr:troponin T, skeletal muscle-like [Carya illinoinensis]XP_042940740.1 troponin T, skeletal muscle-like [Carya illinoinensis]XP_042940741.1 troponin T, skeletal muscle-like [Carya illinoinensis]KAG6641725.1 hypothetical protein CIPAW_09G094500 [Carya illinoinensis]KAG6641726.1 hypothetical protein CIPAW_09G094500 [Carya illinoinensis]KAG6641727.1 hypothetical protein CIPAW_09G094500 [Carya illinoinensis]